MVSAARAKAERRAQRDAFNALGLTFWHGGAPGFEPGQQIVSPNRMGGLIANIPIVPGYGEHPGREDRVYFTTDRELARAYAWRSALRPEATGSLYRVIPVGIPEIDPDYAHHAEANLSFQCAAIVIVAVEEAPVVMTQTEATAAAGRYMTWDDGRPMYDSDGYFIPSTETLRNGLTHADARRLWAPWTPYEAIVADSGRAQKYVEERSRQDRH